MNCQWCLLLVWAEWGQSTAWHCGPTGSPEQHRHLLQCPGTRHSELHWPSLPAQADFPPKTAFQLASFSCFSSFISLVLFLSSLSPFKVPQVLRLPAVPASVRAPLRPLCVSASTGTLALCSQNLEHFFDLTGNK